MTNTKEIPADIRRLSEELVIYGPVGGRSALQRLIAKALLEERHRCAVIARQWKETPHKSEQYAANTIADRIMAGDAA
jgi:hypothetical protein